MPEDKPHTNVNAASMIWWKLTEIGRIDDALLDLNPFRCDFAAALGTFLHTAPFITISA